MNETEQDHKRFEEAAPIYATGGLEPKEREEFEAHLESGCSACFDVLKELQPPTPFQPEDPDVVHSETLKKIPEHEQIDPEHSQPMPRPRRQDKRRDRWASLRPILTSGVLALILIVVALGSLWYAVNGQSDLSHLVEERQQLELDVKELSQRMEGFQSEMKNQARLVSEIRKLYIRNSPTPVDINSLSEPSVSQEEALDEKLKKKEKENALLLQDITKMSEYEAFIHSSRLQVVPFVGKGSSDPKAFFFYDPETRNGLFYGGNFPPLPPKAVYQLWVLIKRPLSLGTFTPGGGKSGRLWMERILTLPPGTKFALSVEREKGVNKPTGEILLLGQLGSST